MVLLSHELVNRIFHTERLRSEVVVVVVVVARRSGARREGMRLLPTIVPGSRRRRIR